jgi:hypothetical protein
VILRLIIALIVRVGGIVGISGGRPSLVVSIIIITIIIVMSKLYNVAQVSRGKL